MERPPNGGRSPLTEEALTPGHSHRLADPTTNPPLTAESVGRYTLPVTGGTAMKLGLSIGYSRAQLDVPIKLIQRAEELGYDSVWTAEAYGSDAVTPLAYIEIGRAHV